MCALEMQSSSQEMPSRSSDRRSRSRLPTHTPVEIHRVSMQTWVHAHVNDISDQGMLLVAHGTIFPGEQIVLDLELTMPMTLRMGLEEGCLAVAGPPTLHSLRVHAIVMRVERAMSGVWHLAVQYAHETSAIDRAIIDAYLEYLESDEEQFELHCPRVLTLG